MTPDDLALLQRLVDASAAAADGHLTIMKFTTNWRVGFGTPFEREDIDAMPVGASFAEAARKLLAEAEVK